MEAALAAANKRPSSELGVVAPVETKNVPLVSRVKEVKKFPR
jgi:hypothetical protein